MSDDTTHPDAEDSLVERAARNVRVLRRLNVLTVCVAAIVWTVLMTLAAIYRLLGLAVFPSCVMLAELLLFQTVRTLADHLDLARAR